MGHAVPRSPEGADAEPAHGGRLHAAARAYPHAPRPWIDLSTGVNPHAWPMPRVPESAWTRLPEPEELAALEAAALSGYRARPGWHAVAAPGTSILIALLSRLHPGPAAIVGPTYGEYAAAWPAAPVVPDLPAAVRAARVRVVCHPDNPTGAVQDPAELAAAARDGIALVDESYADFAPGAALEQAVDAQPGLVVLRSFGKAYGLAGLRLGFALAHPSEAARIRRALGPWPVSGPAILAGTEALADQAWHTATARRLAADRDRFDALLHRAGFTALRGTALFTLARIPAPALGPGWAGHMAQRGILVRTFADRPDHIRFGLPPPDPRAWQRVADALASGPA